MQTQTTQSGDLRHQVEEHLARKAWNGAKAALEELWRRYPNAGTAAYLVQRYQELCRHLPFVSARLAILRSFTLEPAVPIVRAAALAGGIDLTVQIGAFNAYAPEILDSGSDLYKFGANIVILAVQTRDVAPQLWECYADLSEADAKRIGDGVIADFGTWITTFRAQSPAHLVIHGLDLASIASQGVLDDQLPHGQLAAIRRVNRELQTIAARTPGVYYLDYDGLVARHGRLHWYDERKWLTMRMPIGANNLGHLAEEWLRFIHPLSGKISKVLVTDLDNTLWGGVIGEDGMEGIHVGREYPGAAYLAVQRALRDLSQRGVLLAVCSKNNEADALRALDRHPEMILRSADFATCRINWNDKAANIRDIARELSVGVDAVCFLDDNPIERERVRTELPEVAVIELPDDPGGYASAVRRSPLFERLSLSNEDRMRGQMYAEQRVRQDLADSTGSIEAFYKSLEQQVEIMLVSRETSARVAQLTQKTNQFNLTTRRYSEQQILELAASPGWRVYAARVKDRFGDNGIVGTVIVRVARETWEIDTFLLSCRVIGRTVETAILSFLTTESRQKGASLLQGHFIATAKNKPAASFYPSHGFKPVDSGADWTLWSLTPARTNVDCPAWIRLNLAEGPLLSDHAII
jgi:FkbH-like protein